MSLKVSVSISSSAHGTERNLSSTYPLSADPNTTARSKGFFRYLRLAVGAILFIVLIQLLDFPKLRLTLASIVPEFLVLGLFSIVLNFVLKTYRWAAILWLHEPNISFSQLIRFNYTSMFLANFLPGSVSSDIVRCYQISKYTSEIKTAISSVIVDRIVGIFSTAVFAILALLALQGTDIIQVGPFLFYGAIGSLIFFLAAALALQNSRLMNAVHQFLARFLHLPERLVHLYDHFLLYRQRPGILLLALLVAFLNIAIAAFEFYAVALGFSAEVSVVYFLLLVPLAIFLSMLPLSWGGVGILEVSLVFFLTKVGMPLEVSLSIVLVRRVLFLLSTIPGGIFYMIEGFPVRKFST